MPKTRHVCILVCSLSAHGLIALLNKARNQAQTHVIKEHVHSFLWRVMQHVLPEGLRRVRSCGVLHGNAKKRLAQLMSKMGIKPPPASKQPDTKTAVLCPCCHSPMVLTGMTLPNKALPGSPI